MNCPVCSVRLRRVKSKTAVVDVCPRCAGIWFDEGELFDFVNSLIDSQQAAEDTLRLFRPRDVQKADSSIGPSRVCPRCGQPMRTFNYAYDSNVFLEKCPACDGIWADRGEAEQIAGYLKKDPRVEQIAAHLVKHSTDLRQAREFGGLAAALTRPISPAIFYMPRIIIPLGDDAPRQRFPVVTLSLVTLCVVTFLGQMFLVADPESFVRSFGFVPADFVSIGLITSMFLHADVFHLIGNMLFLWLFGHNVEDRFGRLGYLFFYLSCGVFGDALHAVFNWGSSIPAVGASGAISGVMGAYLLFFPSAKLKLLVWYRIVEVPACVYLVGWFSFQLIFPFVHRTLDCSAIAWFAHIGGFIFGVLVAFAKKKLLASRR